MTQNPGIDIGNLVSNMGETIVPKLFVEEGSLFRNAHYKGGTRCDYRF